MEPAKKININELKQARGNIEPEKTVKEVIAESQNSETKNEVSGTEVKETEASTKVTEKAYVAHGALSPDATNNINAILKRYKRSEFEKYTTTAEYSKAIGAMSLNALHSHAIDVQVIPTSDKEKLIKNLENAFGVYINKNAPKEFPPSNLTIKNKDEIEAIIAKKMRQNRKF
jgi:hypothetical protein